MFTKDIKGKKGINPETPMKISMKRQSSAIRALSSIDVLSPGKPVPVETIKLFSRKKTMVINESPQK